MFRCAAALPFLILLILGTCAPDAHAQSGACSRVAWVSGYSSGVHLYDGCSGSFLRMLDTEPGRILGPQAIRPGPDGLVYVVSEGNGYIQRYRADSFAYAGRAAETGAAFGLTGIAFRGESDLYACGYNASTVRLYGLDGQLRATPVPDSAGVRGPDNGMTVGPDGLLYVPGYNSHNVLRHDPASGQSSVLVAARSGGLRQARGILFRPDGASFFVTGEGSGQVLEYRRDSGALVRVLATGLSRPTGMDWAPDGSLAVVTQDGVLRLDPSTGASRGVLIPAGSGGLNQPTFIAFIEPRAPQAMVDVEQIGTQYWISGAGRIEGRRVIVDAMFSTTGPAFGDAYDASDAVSRRWGSLEIDFSGCSSAQLHWDSSGTDSAGFGQGQQVLERFLPGAGTQRCEQSGFANSPPEDWMQGTWWGGPTRSGEGLVFEYVNDSTIVVSWFTHRPELP